MPAIPVISASLATGFEGGITLYQNQAASVNLNKLILVSLLGEKLPGFATGVFNGTSNIFTNRIRITASSLPAGLTTPATYGSSNSNLEGTPTTVATTNMLFKIEVFRYDDNGGGTSSNIATGYITVPVDVVAMPSSVTPATAAPVILSSVINAVNGTYLTFPLYAAIETSPVYWSATGLPAGLNVEGSNIEGTPTATGTTSATISLRYKPDDDAGYITETKSVSIVVTDAVATSIGTGPAHIADGGIDLFIDLQSMALSLDLPKEASVIAADAQVINSTTGKKLTVKPGVVLNLNVRFTKGASIVDPDPTAMRFGAASKIGGPLLMEGTSFTKVGTGSSAYFKMRITSADAEFAALERDYYDADAVEQVSATSDTQGGGQEPLDGLCELRFETGAGGTLATFRSDHLPVIIRRALLI